MSADSTEGVRVRSGAGAQMSHSEGESGPWTVMRLIRWSTDYLNGKGVENARLDTELLLAHALETDRLQLYLQFDRPLTPDELDRFRPMLRRRAGREPLQYITGVAGFRELELKTDRRALIPRPETEVLVEVVLDWAGARGEGPLSAVDFGTGTGCVALSLAHEADFDPVWAVDASAEALELARLNAQGVEGAEVVRFVEGAGLDALPSGTRVDAIVSNPPYVAEVEAAELQPEVVDHEPHMALFSGPDGLGVIRDLVREAPGFLREGGLLALEIGAEQGPAVQALLREGGFAEVVIRDDLSGRPRIVSGVRG